MVNIGGSTASGKGLNCKCLDGRIVESSSLVHPWLDLRLAVVTSLTSPTSLFLQSADHGKIEGDASLSREDYHFNGQNSKLSQERYAAFKSFNDKYSGGNATKESLIEYRYQRFLDSRNHNPSFTFLPPRYIFSYGEVSTSTWTICH